MQKLDKVREELFNITCDISALTLSCDRYFKIGVNKYNVSILKKNGEITIEGSVSQTSNLTLYKIAETETPDTKYDISLTQKGTTSVYTYTINTINTI